VLKKVLHEFFQSFIGLAANDCEPLCRKGRHAGDAASAGSGAYRAFAAENGFEVEYFSSLSGFQR